MSVTPNFTTKPKSLKERAEELWQAEEAKAQRFSRQYTPVQRIVERRKSEMRIESKLKEEYDEQGNPRSPS